MSSYLELKEQAEALMKQAEEVRAQEIQIVIKEIADKLKAYDLSIADIEKFIGHKSKTSNAPKNPKYKDPSTGRTWTGFGRAPQWMPADKSSWDSFLI